MSKKYYIEKWRHPNFKPSVADGPISGGSMPVNIYGSYDEEEANRKMKSLKKETNMDDYYFIKIRG